MASKAVSRTEYTDDLDGGPASRTVEFGYDGTSYEIDLNDANAAAFADAVAVYVGHARRVRTAPRRTSTPLKGRRGST